jgi:hypothetical protein
MLLNWCYSIRLKGYKTLKRYSNLCENIKIVVLIIYQLIYTFK